MRPTQLMDVVSQKANSSSGSSCNQMTFLITYGGKDICQISSLPTLRLVHQRAKKDANTNTNINMHMMRRTRNWNKKGVKKKTTLVSSGNDHTACPINSIHISAVLCQRQSAMMPSRHGGMSSCHITETNLTLCAHTKKVNYGQPARIF